MITWCTGKLAILKGLQILCATMVVLFLLEGRSQWSAYTLIFVTAIALGVISFLTLLLYFLQVHRSESAKSFPWVTFELAFNLIATVLCLCFSAVLLYDYIKTSGGSWHHHRHLPARNIGKDGWSNRIIIVMVAEILSTLFYAISLTHTKMQGIR